MIRRLAAAALCAGLAVSSTLAAAGELPLGQDNTGAIKGHRKVAIAEFDVEFLTQVYAQDHAAGGSMGGSKAMVTANLTGVGDATFQAITDQAYADTVAALTEAGFEIVDPAALAANTDWQAQVQKYGLDSPYTFSDSTFGEANPQVSRIVAPTGSKAFFSTSTGRGTMSQRTSAQDAGRAGKEVAVAKALGADLLHVHYLASFGITSKPKRGWVMLGSTFSNASITPTPVLLPDDTEIQVISQSGQRYFTTSKRSRFNGAVYLDDPYVVEPNVITMTESTTASQKKGDAVTNAIGGLFGTGMQKTKSFTATVTSEDAFKTTYQKMIGDAAAAFAGALGAAL